MHINQVGNLKNPLFATTEALSFEFVFTLVRLRAYLLTILSAENETHLVIPPFNDLIHNKQLKRPTLYSQRDLTRTED